MNGGMLPGLQLNAEPLAPNTIGMEVVTISGNYVTKADNFEITLIGGGSNGTTQGSGGDSGANVIKRIVGLPAGTSLTVVIGGVQGASTCLIPGFDQLTANGGAGAGVGSAIAQGGDININGQPGTTLDQNGSAGIGGSTLLGFGGISNSPRGNNGNGYGSGGGAGKTVSSTGGSGQPGVMVIRYF